MLIKNEERSVTTATGAGEREREEKKKHGGRIASIRIRAAT